MQAPAAEALAVLAEAPAQLAAACASVAQSAAAVLDHLVGGRWQAALDMARDTLTACGNAALSLVPGLLPALGL